MRPPAIVHNSQCEDCNGSPILALQSNNQACASLILDCQQYILIGGNEKPVGLEEVGDGWSIQCPCGQRVTFEPDDGSSIPDDII